MQMKINLFAGLRDAAGKNQIQLMWKQGMTCRDVLNSLKENLPPAAALVEHSFVAVNGSYADSDRYLMPEDEVAVLPPVSGG